MDCRSMGLMNDKSSFFKRGSLKIGDDQSTSYWDDTWSGDMPLVLQYSTMYTFVFRKEDSVASDLRGGPLNIQYFRALLSDK